MMTLSNKTYVFRKDLSREKIFQEGYLLFGLLLTLWLLMPGFLRKYDQTMGGVDPGIWLLILLSILSFMMVAALSWWLLQRFWMGLGLPHIGVMVLQFKTLELWQQLGFYWASFALLLLAGIVSLSAIC